MRKAFAIFTLLAAALLGAPAFAESSPILELAAWVRSNTDLAVSQVAIAGPENVYSVEQLGPRLPTGEVLALVRTEAVSDEWRDAHQFQSWDAHMLFDCQGGRVRVLRSASYRDRDRVGPVKADDRGDAAFEPESGTPAATLLAAACDANFSWPLRGSPASGPTKATPLGGPSMLQTASTGSSSRVTRATTPVLLQTVVQVARAPSVLLDDVQPIHLAALVETTGVGKRRPQVVTAARVFAPVPTQVRQASSPDMAQFAADAAAEGVRLPLQKVSFVSEPSLQMTTSVREPAQASPAPRRAGVFATAAAATRTWRRLAVAGRSWLVRRVEVAFRQDDGRSRTESGLIRLSQAS